MDFLQAKFSELAKGKPRLFVMSAQNQSQYFFNPLGEDEYFLKIMKKKDQELMKALVRALEH